MRTIAILGSSLLGAVLLGALPQQPPRTDRTKDAAQLRALAAAPDEAAREEILKTFDDYPASWLQSARMLPFMVPASPKSPENEAEIENAVRRWLPHPAWNGQVQKVGEARAREKKLVGGDSKREPGDLARALQRKLEEGDLETKKTVLQLFAQIPAPAPEKVFALLKSEDAALRHLAAAALAWSPEPAAAREVLNVFRDLPAIEGLHLAQVLSGIGSSELVPDLLDLLAKDPSLARGIVVALETLGDVRAEAALIGLLGKEPRGPTFTTIQTLSLLGGSAAVEAIRNVRAAISEGDQRKAWCRSSLTRLRAPGLAPELWAGIRDGSPDSSLRLEELETLGDRSILPDIVDFVKDRKRKIEERRGGLKLLGKLGDAGHRALLEEYLADERFEAAAAQALMNLGDPAAAPALARALKGAEDSVQDIARALMALKPSAEAIETPIVEILSDPKGHSRAVRAAMDLGVKFGSPRVRSLVLEAGISLRSYDLTLAHVMALIPSITPDDRSRLEKGRADARGSAYVSCSFALAALGDPRVLKELIDFLPNGSSYFSTGVRDVNPLSLFPKDPEGLALRVEETFAKNLKWYDGAEWLYLHGNPKGIELLVAQIREPSSRFLDRAAYALLLGKEASIVPDLLRRSRKYLFSPAVCDLLAPALSEEDAARLRDELWDRVNFINPPILRLLARRDDPLLIPYLRKKLRTNYIDNAVHDQVNDGAEELRLARLRVPGVGNDFIRLLRSRAPSRRMLAARCLAILGDRSAISAIALLCDDLEQEDQHGRDEDPYHRPRQVREAAADAIEALAGVTFQGSPAERAKAAKEWVAKNRTQ